MIERVLEYAVVLGARTVGRHGYDGDHVDDVIVVVTASGLARWCRYCDCVCIEMMIGTTSVGVIS